MGVLTNSSLFFVAFFLLFFSCRFITKMRNIFLFLYLPSVILEAKTFQRETDVRERDGVVSPRSWEAWVEDYKKMMDPSKCRKTEWNLPCVDGRRVLCRSKVSKDHSYVKIACSRSSVGSVRGWQWTRFHNRDFKCLSSSMCRYIEWFYHENGAAARGYELDGSGKEIYAEIVRRINEEGGRSHAQSVTN